MNEDFPLTHKSCPNCGDIVTADSRFCNHCAFDLVGLTQPSAQTDAREGRSPSISKYVLLAAGLVMALVLALVTLFIYRSRHSNVPLTSAPSQTMGDRAKQVEEKILKGETLTIADIAGLSAYELRVIRNMHFARYGRSYERPGLGDYFYTRPWYKPSATYSDSLITAMDKANINLILAEENKVRAAEAAASTANTPTTNTGVTGSADSQLTTEAPRPSTITNLDRKVLDRPTALSIAKEKISIPVTKSAWQDNTHQGEYVKYKPLVEAGVISCQSRYGLLEGGTRRPVPSSFEYYNCQPGPNGNGIVASNNELFLVLGYKKPAQVTGISMRDQGSAIVDITVSFERSGGFDLYEKYKKQFDELFGPLYDNMFRNEERRAYFKLYDDGWRIEDVMSK